jgi:hypothetical protein
MSTPKLLAAIREHGALVYGTGYVAKLFRRGLHEQGLDACVRAHVVSGTVADDATCEGKPVRCARDYAFDGELVCVAVHESNRADVEALLLELGVTTSVWVYYNLFDLMYGEPIERGRRVPVTTILRAQDPGCHWLDVRALAIKGLLADEPLGESAYLKAQAMHSSPHTARKRHELLSSLVASVTRDGFDPTRPVLLTEDLMIVDGLHRISLAWCLGEPELDCNIVATTPRYEELLNREVRLPEAMLRKVGLTPEERAALDAVHREMEIGADHV